MILLVLEDSRGKIVGAQLDPIALAVQRTNPDLPRARHLAANVGNAQTTFPVLHDIAADDDNLGIDDGERFRIAVLVSLSGGIERSDEQPQAFVHLRRRQTDAVILDHRVDHVVDQPLDHHALELGLLDRAGFRAQYRMAHARDLQNRHDRRIILCGTCDRAPLAPVAPSHLIMMSALDPHDDSHAYQFCPRCSGQLERRRLKSTEPERPVCTRCGFVFYLDPKVAVGTIIQTEDDRLVLVRRAIEPGYGKWVFPGGYVDRGEALTSAALREAREECGLDVRLDGLVNVYSYPGRAPVIIVFAATAIGGTLCVDDECLETAEVERATIPWTDLAFRSTRDALRAYLYGVRHPIPI
jgi:8-oxo-dGTP diphosphatase